MAKRKQHKRKGKKGQALFGTETVKKHPFLTAVAEGSLVLLTAVASAGAGAALGKHSLIPAVPLTAFGIHKRSKYLIAAGIGLALGSGKSIVQNSGSATQGIDGFDIKQIAEQAKDRATSFFKDFSEKLYLSPPKQEGQQTQGLQGDEQVSYFINPYNKSSEIDMSDIDRVQEHIAEMNGSGNSVNDLDREF